PLRSERLAARERQQALGQRGSSLGGMSRRSRKASDTFTIAHTVLLDQLDIAQHGSEQIVEIMRDPTCQLPEGLHLLCLVQLTLGGLPLSNFRLQSCVYCAHLFGAFCRVLSPFRKVEVPPQPTHNSPVELGC